MFTEQKKNLSKFVVLLISLILILSASMPTYFAHATGEKYTEQEISEANKALDDYLAGENNNLISNGGTWNPETEYGRLKSKDGLTYTIGYKMNISNTPDFTSLTFNFFKFKDHMAVVFFDGSVMESKTAPNGTKKVVKIKRRPKDQDITVNAKLALFKKNSNNIHVQQGKVDPIAQRDIKIILKAPKSENAPVKISVKAYDKDSGKEILKNSNNLAVNLYKDRQGREPVNNLNGVYDYSVQKNTSYYLSVKADGYQDYFEECRPTKAGEYKVNLKKKQVAINKYKLKINVKNPKGEAIANPKIEVAIPGEEDEWGGYEEDTPVSPSQDGTYELSKYGEYNIKVSANGYKTPDGKGAYSKYGFTPSGTDELINLDVVLTNGNDQPSGFEQLNKINSEFDKLYVLRPKFTKNKNINEFVKESLNKKTSLSDIDFSKIHFEVAESEDTEYIKNDGTIVYRKGGLNDNFVANIPVSFKIKYKDTSVQTKKHTVTVGWDQNYYKERMQEEAANVDKAFISKNQVLNFDAIENNFTLPTVLKEDKRVVWSEIKWTSSNPAVIEIKDNPTRPFTKNAIVNRTANEETVTLTATFVALDNHLNQNLGESVDNFPKIEKKFVVKVKPVKTESAEELKEILDKYYKEITDVFSGEKSSLQNLVDDVNLPRYTRIKDENNKDVFENNEIEVTSDNPSAIVKGYRVNIDPFGDKKDGHLKITFTRKGITAVKEVPFTIGTISKAELDKEVKMMEYAKEHYFDGIKGKNKKADNITENMKAFQEMLLDKDGEAVWVYSANGVKGTGIKPDNFFEDAFQSESARYNKFKSSNKNVVSLEDLKVTRPERTTEVEISSLLSSERFGRWAEKHPENKTLQRLYKQPVKVTVKVKGTNDPSDNLASLIKEAKELSANAVEGNKPGEYEAGAKNKLDAAIAKAEKLLKSTPSEEQIVSEIAELENAVKIFKDKQNVKKTTIWITAGKDNNKLYYAKKIDVTADLARKYGYVKDEKYSNEVTVIDALAAMHADKYRGDFEANPQNYLKSGPEGWLTKIFGIETFNISYLVNYNYPLLSPGLGSVANNTVLKDNDIFSIAILQGTYPKLDVFLSFDTIEKSAEQNEEFALTLYSNHFVDDTTVKPSPLANTKVQLTDFNGKKVAEAVTDDKGMANFKVDKAGKYMAGVIAEGDKPFENFEQPYCEITVKTASIWDFDKATKTLKGFKAGENFDNQAILDIPDEIDGVPVEHIADSAFKYALWGSKVKNKITELRIPASVKSIGKDAFKGNDTLTTLKFKSEGDNESSLEKIDEGAFMSCGLQSLDLPSSVKEVGKGAFSMNNIEKLILPESLEKLGEGAFGCNLIESVIIPSGVKEFPTAGNGVFYKNFREKTQGSSYKGSLRYVKVFDKSGKATAFNTGGVVNPVPVKVKYVDQDGKSLRDEEIVYGCKYQTTYESRGKVTLGNGDKSFLKNYNGSNGTNSGNTSSEIFKRKELADAIIGQNYFRDGQEYIFPKDNAPSIEGYIKPEKDIKKTITQTDYVVEYVYQSKAPVKVDKTELEKALKAAEEAKQNIKTSADGKDVEPSDKWTTTEELKALEAAITEAKKVDEDASAKQEAVNKAKADLEKSTKKFTDSLKAGMKEEPKVDKTELEKAIKAAEDAKENVKTSADGKDVELTDKWTTSEEIKTLEAAISEAKKVDEDANAKQEGVDKAKADLEKATKKFTDSLKAGTKEEVKVDKTELEKALKTAEEAKENIKTSADGKDVEPTDKWTTSAEMKAFEAAISEAKKVDEDANAKQDGVNKAKADLETATRKFTDSLKAGKKAQSPNPGTDPQNPSDPGTPNPGTNPSDNPVHRDLKVVTEGENDSSTVAKGNQVIYIIGNSTKAVFRILGEDLKVTDLESVLLDGKLVDPSNYDVRQGSIIVTFKKPYLDSLKAGKHEVTFNTTKGIAKAELVIKDKTKSQITADNNKKGLTNTGDASGAVVYSLIIITALGAGYVIARKKNI